MGRSRFCSNPAKFKNHKKLEARNLLQTDFVNLYNATNPPAKLTEGRVCITCYRRICDIIHPESKRSKRSAPDANSPTERQSPQVSCPRESTNLGQSSEAQDRLPSVMNVIVPGISILRKSKVKVTQAESVLPVSRTTLTSSQTTATDSSEAAHVTSASSLIDQGKQIEEEEVAGFSGRRNPGGHRNQPFTVPKLYSTHHQSEELQLDDLPSITGSVAPSNDSGSVFENENTRLEEANRSLSAVGISPITSMKIPKKSVAKKYVKAKLAIAEKLGLSTKTTLPLSPKGNCSWCDKLIEYLPSRYHMSSSKQDRYRILTTVPLVTPIFTVQNLFKCSFNMAKEASKYKRKYGPFFCPSFKTPDRGTPASLIDAVINFYNSDDNSRVLAGERNSVISTQRDGTKARTQKRLILMSLRELYAEFLKSDECTSLGILGMQEAVIGVSKFAALRPRHCSWPGLKGHHQTCLCIIHENFKLLCDVSGLPTKTDEFTCKYLCSEPSDNCFLGFCSECPKDDNITDDIRKYIGNDDVMYYLWKSTDRTDLVEVRETADEFIQGFLEKVRKFTADVLVTRKQQDFIANLRTLISVEKSVIVQVDFGMNFTFVSHEEVQSAHFNPPQATVHPFVVNGLLGGGAKVSQKSYVVLSDDLNHSSNTFYAFNFAVMDLIKRDFSGVEHIHYVSDGSAAQYKNYKNLVNLYYHRVDYKLTADWHFTSTAHGKSTCDAITGVVKRTTRLHSLKPGVVCRNLDHMVLFCKGQWANHPTIEIVEVRKESVSMRTPMLEERYSKAYRLPGIQEKHSFVPVGHGVEVRRFSSSRNMEMFFPNGEPLEPAIFSKNVGEFVAFRVNDSYQVGSIQEIDEESGFITITCMMRYRTINSFTWPEVAKVETVPILDVLGNVNEPSKNSPTARVCRLLASDFKKFNAIVKNIRAVERREEQFALGLL